MTSPFARLQQRSQIITVADAIGVFLAEHQLSPGSQRVYAGALRKLQQDLGAGTALTALDEAHTAKLFADWFRRRYVQTAPATQVLQLAILRSACTSWRQRGWAGR